MDCLPKVILQVIVTVVLCMIEQAPLTESLWHHLYLHSLLPSSFPSCTILLSWLIESMTDLTLPSSSMVHDDLSHQREFRDMTT